MGRERLGRLFERYAPACLAFLSNQFHLPTADIEDIWAGFAADKLVRDNILKEVKARKSFRSFLRVALRNYGNSWLRGQSTKARRPEGGFQDLSTIEDIPEEASTEIDAFDLQFARQVLGEAIARVEVAFGEYGGPPCSFRVFRVCVADPLATGSEAWKPGKAATQFGISPFQVGRIREWGAKRMRASLREVVSEYCVEPMDAERELQAILEILRRAAR